MTPSSISLSTYLKGNNYFILPKSSESYLKRMSALASSYINYGNEIKYSLLVKGNSVKGQRVTTLIRACISLWFTIHCKNFETCNTTNHQHILGVITK